MTNSATSQRPATGLSFRTLDAIGVEVLDFDLDQLDGEVEGRLYSAWLEHGVLLFRGVGTSSDAHLRLSRVFGPLEPHPLKSLHVENSEDLVFFGGGDKGPKLIVDGQPLAGYLFYHQDTAYTPNICKGGVLRMIERPRVGGDTVWADTARAYEHLPADLRTRLDSLEMIQSCRPVPRRSWGTPGLDIRFPSVPGLRQVDYDFPDMPQVVHPMVTVHPETGRKSLLLSPLGFDRVVGLPLVDGDELFDTVMRHVLQPQFLYRHRWSTDDIVLWDNRRTMHCATGYPYDETRLVYRTTLGGAQPTGRYL